MCGTMLQHALKYCARLPIGATADNVKLNHFIWRKYFSGRLLANLEMGNIPAAHPLAGCSGAVDWGEVN